MTAQAAEIDQYLAEVDKLYRAGNATEHSYRPALKSLFENITSGLVITNEPKHIDCGAPDYIITKDSLPLGYIEAKDIPVHLGDKNHQEQFNRYKQALGNLIITNYISFQLFIDGELAAQAELAQESPDGISADKSQFPAFLELIDRFIKYSGKTISNSDQLAKTMAERSKLLAEIIKNALGNKSCGGSLSEEYAGFRKILIHNLEIAQFADIYAQTLAYGLFAARLNQKTDEPFTRYIAPLFIPQSNPFLRKFFNYVSGINLDSRITWIVDALADLFNCVAIEEVQKEFGMAAQDPYIHFYETFLAEYDPTLRETRGVYYTPVTVVQFIVQAVDDILKSEFCLQKGLADYSKIKRDVRGKNGAPEKSGAKETAEFHKVQILDPSAGTGTFLAEVIEKIYSYFANNKGAWCDYCENHLIPRINGFEILMASYAMAHFKLDMKLKETGYSFKEGGRLRVYLTNSLEEPRGEVFESFMENWLAAEANEANSIKKNTPVMVVLGNPPYSGESANITADAFLAAYKKEPGGLDKLQEKNSKWLNDDYVKFIRYGQNLIEKYGEGVLAYINNHSFLDNPTFRGMRWNLLSAFDTIYILDLHGNANKRETVPDGSKDENVFNIQVGVSINIFIKTGKKKSGALAQVFHYDVYGKREAKHIFLRENTLSTINWKKLPLEGPQYFFTEKDFTNKAKYEEGFSVLELFKAYSTGVVTARDEFTVHYTEKELKKTILDFLLMDDETARQKFNLGKDMRDWSVAGARKDLILDNNGSKTADFNKIVKIDYRTFDTRFTYYTGRSRGFHCMPRNDIMRHFLVGENTGLMMCRQQKASDFYHCLVHKHIVESSFVSNKTSEIGCSFPLYLYNADNSDERVPNLNEAAIAAFAEKTGLSFTAEKTGSDNLFSPIDLLDYIYAVLYSNNYRAKYREFLKIDFPRVPYPENAEQFNKLTALGAMLRGLHLMENVSPIMNLANFPVAGTNKIETVKYKEEKVYVNKTQYFENVPPEIAEYYIGGYQPAQKWLKDRRGRVLSFDDIEHYQKISAALKMTIELQAQIDEMF